MPYNTVRGNDTAYDNGVKVLKQYAKENMASAKEIMMSYLSEEFTPEDQADLQEVVTHLKQNSDSEVYSTIKLYLETLVQEYLDKNHYLKKSDDCPDFNICH